MAVLNRIAVGADVSELVSVVCRVGFRFQGTPVLINILKPQACLSAGKQWVCLAKLLSLPPPLPPPLLLPLLLLLLLLLLQYQLLQSLPMLTGPWPYEPAARGRAAVAGAQQAAGVRHR